MENSIIWNEACIPTFIAALFTIAKTWELPKCSSTDEWIKKMWCAYTYTHTHNEILLSHKKWSNVIWSNIDGPRDHYTKWSQVIMREINTICHLHVESKIWLKGTYLRNRNRNTDGRVVVTQGEVRKGLESGVNRCKLLSTGWTITRFYSIAQGTLRNILW